MRGRLLEQQPDCNEPLTLTHFECWFNDDDDSEYQRGCGKTIWDVTVSEFFQMADTVVASWSETLGLPLAPVFERAAGRTTHWEQGDVLGVFNPVIDAILDAGYDVYASDTMIEIYPAGVE